MFMIYNCSYEIDRLSYNLRNDKKDINTIIQKYSLSKKGFYKELWENNTRITISGNERLFHSITDINYSYDKSNNKLIHELSISDCQPYNFYKVDQEDIYELYENTIKNVKIQLREYIDYFILIYLCDTIDDFNQLKVF